MSADDRRCQEDTIIKTVRSECKSIRSNRTHVGVRGQGPIVIARTTAPTMKTSPTALAQLAYPRTGKRGVPQQFPRRLYEILDSESKLEVSAPRLICWSDSGKAFRINDVAGFSASLLPK